MFVVLEKGSKNKVLGIEKDKKKAMMMMKKNAGSKVIQIGKFATVDDKPVDIKVGDELSYTRVKLSTKVKEEVELDESQAEMYKLTAMAMKATPGSKAQKAIIKKLNVLRQKAGLQAIPESFDLQEQGPGLWANIHKKRKEGRPMRKKGEKGAPTAAALKRAKGEEVDLDEAKYDLYHKDFSSAMQHAYKMAKKLHGITIDPKEIDDKVATGPSKPSSGKTNKYRLKGDKGSIQVQVYNKGGSKPFELNMYKESFNLARFSDLNEWGEIEEESEYQGRKVTLNKPTKGDVKKSKVYVKNEKGNVVKVEFGDPNMEIKVDSPDRRRSFRARHNCENPGPKWKARYWSCKAW